AAIEPADGRHAEILEPIDHDLEGGAGGLLVSRGRAVGDRIEVVTGGKGAPGAGQDQHPDRGIGFDAVGQLLQRLEILRLQPVQVLWPVQPDGGAGALDGEDGRGGLLSGGCLLHHLFSSARRLASASMVSARSGWRAINRRKSTRSSTRSFDSRVVVML